MLSIIHSHVGMLYAAWIVLIMVALVIVLRLVAQLRGSANWDHIAEVLTRPMLTDILPLIILSWLIVIDPTSVLIRIWYYAAAAAIVIRSLMALFKFARK